MTEKKVGGETEEVAILVAREWEGGQNLLIQLCNDNNHVNVPIMSIFHVNLCLHKGITMGFIDVNIDEAFFN